jgi:hypothetical protein
VIRHIVLFKLHDGIGPGDPRVKTAFDELGKLGGVIPELRFWLVGPNIRPRAVAYDFAVIGDVDSVQDLLRYLDHPDHQAVVGLLKAVCSWVSVDLELHDQVQG